MRFLLKATIPTEAGNAMISENRLATTIKPILEQLKPETAFFAAEDGCRTAYMIVDITDASQIPGFSEPFFLAMNAKVTLTPVMSADDLMKAGPDIEAAVKAWSRQPALAR